MGINQFVKPTSPIEAIGNALKVAESVYGIKNASQLSDKLGRENKAGEEAADPNSDYSKARQAAVGTTLGALVKRGTIGQEDASPLLEATKNASGASIDKLQETSPLFQMAKQDGLLALAAARMKTGQEKNDIQKDRVASSAGDHFDKDPILNKVNKQRQQIELDRHTLENSSVLTPQMLNEVQQGIANALAGGGSAGLGKTKQVEIETFSQKLADAKQRLLSSPEGVNAPDLINYFHGTLSRLGDSYDQSAWNRAQQIYKGRSLGYKSNPAALDVMRAKLESYRPAAKDDSAAPDGGGMPSEGSANAGESGASSQQQGPSVIQNAALNILKKRRGTQ